MEKRKPGRGSQMTPTERKEIQHMFLVDGLSQSEIARRTARDRGTVSAVVAAADTQELKAALLSEQREAALEVLRAGTIAAASAWRHATEVAAKKGDHRPAKDLLLATEVIQDQAAPQSGVVILIGQPGRPLAFDPPIDVTAINTEAE